MEKLDINAAFGNSTVNVISVASSRMLATRLFMFVVANL